MKKILNLIALLVAMTNTTTAQNTAQPTNMTIYDKEGNLTNSYEFKYDANGNQIEEAYSWKNYTIFLSVGIGAIADVIIGSDDMSGCAWVRMAQKSADELRIEELEERVRQLEGGES